MVRGRAAPSAAGGLAAGVPRIERHRPGYRPAGEVGGGHGRAVPRRRADGGGDQRHRERLRLPARVGGMSLRPAPIDCRGQPGQAEDDPGGVAQRVLAV